MPLKLVNMLAVGRQELRVSAVDCEVGDKGQPLVFPGPSDYNTHLPQLVMKRSPRCSFGSTPRLGMAMEKDADGAIRYVSQSGRGHWCDGLATSTSLPGTYVRFSSRHPTVGQYNLRGMSSRGRLRTPGGGVIGTSRRFKSDPIVHRPKPPSSARGPGAADDDAFGAAAARGAGYRSISGGGGRSIASSK